MSWKKQKIPKTGRNLSRKSRQYSVTRAKQQTQNGKSKYSDKTRNTLLIL